MGKKVKIETIKRLKPDALIVATGSKTAYPPIPGMDKSNVIMARDLLAGKFKAHGKVVIAGGGCMGAQVADFLSSHRMKVTIVEMGPVIAADMPWDEQTLLYGRLAKQNVEMMPNTKILKINSSSVVLQTKKGKQNIKADTVVSCFGSRAVDELSRPAKKFAKKIFVVGDAKQARKALEAIHEGARAGMAI